MVSAGVGWTATPRAKRALGLAGRAAGGAAPAVTALFQEGVVWDAFIAVAGLKVPPVTSNGDGAKDKPRVKRSASLQAAL
jgi:hypothetical protein